MSFFRIAVTSDLFNPDGSCRYADIGLGVIAGMENISHQPLAEYRAVLGADQLAGANGAIVLAPRVTPESVARSENLLAISRFGVGYDSVDVPACTAADVAVLISTGAVDRSVAEATVGWMIALTHHMRTKDALLRSGRWDERSQYMGCELRGRTFGAVGLGGIARAALRLLAPFEMNPPIAFDPYITKEAAASLGVRLVPLAELMGEADFVSIHCPLSADTKDLIGTAELARMKPTAYLINTARGGIVGEAALLSVLRSRRIAGAALDCFVGEPIGADNLWKDLENVLLAPHSIAWTDELFRDVGRAAFQGLVDLAHGRVPRGVVNREVLDRPGFQQKWRRLRVA